MHLVGFIIRIYHDARSPECQNIKVVGLFGGLHFYRKVHLPIGTF